MNDDCGSPPASPTLVRQATVVRRCRDFYARRLQSSEALRRRWHNNQSGGVGGGSGSDSECSSTLSSTCSAQDNTSTKGENTDVDSGVDDCKDETLPGERKSPSAVEFKMDSLRREITSLIECDNALFCQLLKLYDSITELRLQRERRHNMSRDDDDDSTGPLHSPHTPGSLESLSVYEDDEDEDIRRRVTSSSSSPSCECSGSSGLEDSTLSSDVSRSSSDSIKPPLRKQTTQSAQGSTSRRHSAILGGLGCNDGFCSRCQSSGTRKRTPVYRRRAVSHASLVFRHHYRDSFDSGIHLQGSHSESDHEIFV